MVFAVDVIFGQEKISSLFFPLGMLQRYVKLLNNHANLIISMSEFGLQ